MAETVTNPQKDILEPEIAKLVLSRVGGLSVSALDMVTEKTRQLLKDRVAIETQMAEHSNVMVDVLFTLIPQIEDITRRRMVLSGKRRLHQLRPLDWDQDTLIWVTQQVAKRHADLIENYQNLCVQRATVDTELDDAVGLDRTLAINNLYATVEEKSHLESLALASPEWIRYGRPHHNEKLSSRTVRTLLSYTARSAMKTSPFSGLTLVGIAGTSGQGRRWSTTSTIIAALALQGLARDPQTADVLEYELSPLDRGGPREPDGLILLSELIVVDGIVWREERTVEATHAVAWASLLNAHQNERLCLSQILDALGGRDPFSRFRRLLDCGILRVVPPWGPGEHGLDALAALIGQRTMVIPGAVSQLAPLTHLTQLAQLATTGRDICQGDVHARVMAAAECDQAARFWATSIADDRLSLPGLIFEDREPSTDLIDPFALPHVRDDVRHLGKLLRPQIFRSHLYDLIVDTFVREFGSGGVCRDPLGFLMRMSVERDGDPALLAAQRADITCVGDPGERAWLPVGVTSAPPTIGAYVMFAADNINQIENGNYLLVVNQFGTGTGALFARFVGLLGPAVREGIREHIAQCWPGVRCREMPVWTDCHPAQASCAGIVPALGLPGEPNDHATLALRDCSLAHDPQNGTLSLYEPDGTPFGLAYLGLVPPHMHQGYVKLLGIIADPWVKMMSYSDYTLGLMPRLRKAMTTDVVALPRITHGRIVTRRASWVVPVAHLPQPSGGDRRLLVELDAFRRRWNMPAEIFVHPLPSTTVHAPSWHKPIWTTLESPLAYEAFLQGLHPSTQWLRVVEALPGRDGVPQRDKQGRKVTSEYVTLLHWGTQKKAIS